MMDDEYNTIVKEVNEKIKESLNKNGSLVTDERYEELKDRLKKLLQEKEHLSLINEENKNKEQ